MANVVEQKEDKQEEIDILNGREKLFDSVLLDETYRRVKGPTRMPNNIKLMMHQETSLAALINLENGELESSRYRIKHNIGVFANSFGSGKTPVLIALMLLNKTVPRKPIIGLYDTNKRTRLCAENVVEYTFDEKNILNQTLIFVPPAVFVQWRDLLMQTPLRLMMVQNVMELKHFQTALLKGDLNVRYDVVLVKNGNITGKFVISGEHIEKYNDKVQRKIYTMIANICRKYVWNRVIIDDVNEVGVPYPYSMINAYMTWFVSGTELSAYKMTSRKYHTTVEHSLKYHYFSLPHMVSSGMLKPLQVKCSNKYINDSIKLSIPNYFICKTINPHTMQMNMIGTLSGDAIKEVKELLNSDDIEAVAKMIKIDAKNVKEIFVEMLNRDIDKYNKEMDILEYINSLDYGKILELPPPEEDEKYTMQDLYEKKEITKNYRGILATIERMKEKCQKTKELGNVVDRVKENVKDGICKICEGDLDEDNCAINIRCGEIICRNCVIRGSGLHLVDGRLVGKCPYCTSAFDLVRDFKYINEESIDINDIIDVDVKSIEYVRPETKEEKKSLTKYELLEQILDNDASADIQRINMDIPGVIGNTKETSQLILSTSDKQVEVITEKKQIKVLLFTNSDNTIKRFATNFEGRGMMCLTMHGTPKEIQRIVDEFEREKTKDIILLINGNKFCAGTNLQSATHIIFAHFIYNIGVLSQAIGRGQRIGRNSELNVYFLLYDSEIKELFKTYNTVAD